MTKEEKDRAKKEWGIQLRKDIEYADKKEKALERHLNTKLIITVEDFRGIFRDWTDNQRIEVIKAIIWTAPNAQGFCMKVAKLVSSDKFQGNID